MTSYAPGTSTLRVHSFVGLEPGPRVIFLGSVHGNETCGTKALQRVRAELDAGLHLLRGTVSLIPVANPLAARRGERSGERNLNRRLRPTSQPRDYEDRIANVLCPLLARHDVLLDLHSFHTAGEPFALVGPQNNSGELEPFSRSAEEEALVLRLGPRRIVEGWLSTYAAGVKNRMQAATPSERARLANTDPSYGVGTTEFMRSQGGYAVTLECGQHADPQAPEVAYRAIRSTLAHLKLVDEADPAPRGDVELLRLTEVTDLQHMGDRFVREWASYDPLIQGELIGKRADGTAVHAPANGFIVFPNPAATPGNEWFYFAQRSTRTLNGMPASST